MDRMCVSDEKELPHIIVENLSYFCTENALLEHFNAEYPIKSVSMRVKYKNDGDSYPHSATVTLKNPEHEDFMLERFHGTLFMGKFLMMKSFNYRRRRIDSSLPRDISNRIDVMIVSKTQDNSDHRFHLPNLHEGIIRDELEKALGFTLADVKFNRQFRFNEETNRHEAVCTISFVVRGDWEIACFLSPLNVNGYSISVIIPAKKAEYISTMKPSDVGNRTYERAILDDEQKFRRELGSYLTPDVSMDELIKRISSNYKEVTIKK